MNEVLRVIKGISPDRTYVDYVRGNFGVRVWRDRWQPIARADRDSDWQRGEVHHIPIDDRFQDFPIGKTLQPAADLAFRIDCIGNDELRKLISGKMPFDIVACTI